MLHSQAQKLRQRSPSWWRLRWSLPACSFRLIVAALAVVPPAASEPSHASDVGTMQHCPSRASCILGGDFSTGANSLPSLQPPLGIAYESVRVLQGLQQSVLEAHEKALCEPPPAASSRAIGCRAALQRSGTRAQLRGQRAACTALHSARRAIRSLDQCAVGQSILKSCLSNLDARACGLSWSCYTRTGWGRMRCLPECASCSRPVSVLDKQRLQVSDSPDMLVRSFMSRAHRRAAALVRAPHLICSATAVTSTFAQLFCPILCAPPLRCCASTRTTPSSAPMNFACLPAILLGMCTLETSQHMQRRRGMMAARCASAGVAHER
jgi:hypothetical protein